MSEAVPAYTEHRDRDARLVILRELVKQVDGRLNENVLVFALEAFGHRCSRDYVRSQLRKLEEVGAVHISEIGTVMIGSLTRAGQDHVERRSILEGIARPSPGA